ncbi:hypothetical protein MLD38_030510 [Melastoma candidum]|uniref:Uncharacterized protein n=1 Tax=Melastoma candidum TaxID=119954 RepID=A0ACB9MN21_9MYRT|nr:hypothetical protein MLD38_030510 [Melastoma candidum]
MLQLLYTVIFAEAVLILTLLFKTPLRKLVILGLDRVKRGRGPVMVKTVAATVTVVLSSSLYSIAKIHARTAEAGAVIANPTDQVLMSKHILEASLMGFVLFLGLMIDRLHHYIRELRMLRKAMEVAKKQSRGAEDAKNSGEELKGVKDEIISLQAKVKQLESEYAQKSKEAKDAEAEAEALKKQSEDLLLEYDRLLADNQSLKNQLESVEHS